VSELVGTDAGAGEDTESTFVVLLSIFGALLLVGAVATFRRHRNKHRGGRLTTPDTDLASSMTTNPMYHTPGQVATSEPPALAASAASAAQQHTGHDGVIAQVSLGVEGTAALPLTATAEGSPLPPPLLVRPFEATHLPSITSECNAEGALAYEPIPPPVAQPEFECEAIPPPDPKPDYEAVLPPVAGWNVCPEYEVIPSPGLESDYEVIPPVLAEYEVFPSSVLESDYEVIPPVLESEYQEIANLTGPATGVHRLRHEFGPNPRHFSALRCTSLMRAPCNVT